jgi:5-methylcytosine-specific restriction endonuclease McrA
MAMLKQATNASIDILAGQSGNAAKPEQTGARRPRFRVRLHPAVVTNRRAKGKRCRDCKQFRFPTARWYHRDKNRPDGFQLYCKLCKRERDRKSYERHRDRRNASARAWKHGHKDELTAWRFVYNREYRLGRRRRIEHAPEPPQAPEALKLCSSCGGTFPPREFPRGKRECRACWYGRQGKYRNPAKRAVYQQNRRAHEVGRITPAEWAEVLDRYHHRCAYCGASGRLTIDHVQPLSKGGRHEPSNLAPACPSCNSRKHNRLWKPAQLDVPGRHAISGEGDVTGGEGTNAAEALLSAE